MPEYNTNYPQSQGEQILGAHFPTERSYAHSGLRAHWIAFLAVNSFLLLLNLLFGYYYPWHLFPLLSWGIGIGIHSAVYYIRNHIPSPYDRRLYVHFAVFLIVNAFFLAINLLTSPRYLWFIWPMISWGIGLAEHYVAYHALKMRRHKTPVSALYIMWYPGVVCLYLAAVDLISGGGFGWFLWPSIPILIIAYGILQQENVHVVFNRERRQSMPIVQNSSELPENRPNDEFRSSRSKIPNSSLQSENKYCPNCGELISSQNRFCEYCGQNLI